MNGYNSTLGALKLYAQELQKLANRYRSRREKEISKINAKFGDIEFTRDDLADLYGYGNITRAEYEKALDKLDQDDNDRNVAADMKTRTSELLRMLKKDIRNIEYEIAEIEKEIPT